MLNTNNPEVNEMTARIAVLTREIGMLQQAHGHLSGIPARHNAIRIIERQEELSTLEAHMDLFVRFGADEMAHAEAFCR